MEYFRCLLLLLPFILAACGSEDDPKLVVDFQVSCEHNFSTGEPIEVTLEKHGCTLKAIGWEYEYTFDITGVYDYFLLAEGTPDWVSVSTTPSQIKITVKTRYGETPRKGTIHFAVFKGYVSTSGFINIIQEPITEEELREREQFHIANALSGQTIIESIPSDGNFIYGKDAPFYKLSNDVYMQVIIKTSDTSAKSGERVYFRFTRYRLTDWINSDLSNGEGNMNSLTGEPSYFVIGSSSQSTLQWGTAIPFPMLLGLPYGSEVNLIVRSSAGLEAEKSYYQPYFYNIRYYKTAY